jgi:NAD(P)-dependent dehydrogenase (short-subunit alcohol dehydrogenase family)
MIFRDKCVVITGGGSGIGRGLVAGFVKDGAEVVSVGRTEGDLAETARLYGEGRMHYVVGDVSVAADVERLFGEAEERHGKVDVLINNAAVYPKTLFLESDMDDWAKALEINVVGMARCCHRVLPGMLERGFGRILNVGSFAWKGPIPTASAYSTSKGAVSALTKSIACEIDRGRYPDVLVNEFLPGVIHTRMTPDEGDDPMEVYPRAKSVVTLPPGGPNGSVFLMGELLGEDYGLRARLGGLVKKLIGRG